MVTRVPLIVGLLAASAAADPEITIDLKGVKIRHGVLQARVADEKRLDPFVRYGFTIEGEVVGTAGLFKGLYPEPVAFSKVISDLKGNPKALIGEACNDPKKHPATVGTAKIACKETFVGKEVVLNMTFTMEASGKNAASVSLHDVASTPANFAGILEFTSGTIKIKGIKCPVDVDENGVLDIFDFVAMQAAHTNKEPRGDFNCDGAWDQKDLDAFNVAYAIGCPE